MSTQTESSYRRILKSSSIIGGASFANILIGLAREKVLALLLGPIGVGLVSLYRGLMTTASTIAIMGLDTVGTRQIAEANSHTEKRALTVARRALFWGTLALASLGTVVVWGCRAFLAQQVLGSRAQANIVGWLSVGVGCAVIGAAQGSQIQGMQRIGDMARVSVYGAFLNTAVGIAVVWKWGQSALVYYVLAIPMANVLFGYVYVSRLPKVRAYTVSFKEMVGQWKFLFRVGLAFMGGALSLSVVQLWIRIDVNHVLGPRALGFSQASWLISTTYIAFVLNAMAADYYPRLTQVINDPKAATRLVNEQTEIALLLSAPVFLAMISLAPLVLRLLYSSEFSPAVGILRWQILSDVLKVAAWPLGFVFLAAGDGKTFFWTEASTLLIMGGTVTAFLKPVGLDITGSAYLACYVFYLPLVYYLAKKRICFAWTRPVAYQLIVVFVTCSAIDILVTFTRFGAAIGCLLAFFFAVHAFGKITHMSNFSGHVGRFGAVARKLTTSPWG